MPSFIHLRTHSSYSLLEGAMTVKKMPDLCLKNKMPALGITDTNNLFGALEFSQNLSKAGIQPLIGLQIDIQLKSYFTNEKHPKDHTAPVVVFAQSDAGYRNLLKIASRAYLTHSLEDGQEFTTIEDLLTYHSDIILLTGGQLGFIGYLHQHRKTQEATDILLKLKETYGDRLYIELQRIGLNKEVDFEKFFIDMAYTHDIPLVATNDVMFFDKAMHHAHDALICIAEGRYINETDRRQVSEEQYFKSSEEMVALFEDLPEAIENTLEIAQRCHFMVETHPPILPAFVGSGESAAEEKALRDMAHQGLEKRLEKNPLFADKEEYIKRLDFELDIICNMKFSGYFLIVADFIAWAKAQAIPVGPGRGSGAGSLVAWSLTITDLDPLRFGLLFERFLNPERVSMPDFDIDFCQERREEVISYVQQKYGCDHVAQIITFGKLQARAVIRDVGRVMQIPYGQVDRLCKLVPNNPANPMSIPEALESEEAFAQAKKEDEVISNLLDIAIPLEGLYRHASTHAAGVVIGDRPLDELVPMYRDPRSTMPVTQFNMKWVEPAGLVKFDFLGLKTLTVIQKAVALLAMRDIHLNPTEINLKDQQTFDMLGTGESTGIFQLESSGMRDVLRKMKPDSIEDIIALVALYRPGPMDNIPLYITVKKGEKKADYLHPWLEETLKETYGVIIYQEQVMQIAQILSGYSLGEADLLRRAMGKKIKEEMDKQKLRFMQGAKEKGVHEKQAGSIFDLVAKFAGYGFNKSHAAAYAFVSYQTAYLKAHYPHEFMAATMTYDMQNTDKLVVDIEEVKRLKITLVPPCINQSFVDFHVADEKIFYALSAIKNVGEAAMHELVNEREKNGVFKDIRDFAHRMPSSVMNKRTMEFLIKSGALDCLNNNRKQVFESLDLLIAEAQHKQSEKETGQNSLFGGEEAMPELKLVNIADDSLFDRLSHEHAALGFYLSAHPLDEMKEIFSQSHVLSYKNIAAKAQLEKTTGKIAGILTSRQNRKSARGNRYAFIGFSDASAHYEVALFSDHLDQYHDLLEVGQILVLSVEAYLEEEQLRIRVLSITKVEDMQFKSDMNMLMHLSPNTSVEALRSTLARKGNSKVKFQIYDKTLRKHAIILLKERYNVTPALRKKIAEIEGVGKIEMF